MGTELIRERTHSQVEGRQVQHKQDVFTLVHLSCAAQTPASHSLKEESVRLSLTAQKAQTSDNLAGWSHNNKYGR